MRRAARPCEKVDFAATHGPERADDNPLVQLNVDDDTFRRLRLRTGRIPVSFAAGDEDRLRCEVSKSPYYPLLARAVSQLPKNTRTARLALYDRAEVALTAVLLGPEISDEQATFERLALERAIRKIEHDALARVASLQRLMAICADAGDSA